MESETDRETDGQTDRGENERVCERDRREIVIIPELN